MSSARPAQTRDLLVLHPVDAVERELDHQCGRLRRLGVLEALQRACQATVGVLVAAEQMLDAGAGRREPDAQCDRILWDELDALENRRMSLGEVPARGERARAREEKLDALLRRGIIGEEPERARKPGRGARRRTMRCCLAGLAQTSRRRLRRPVFRRARRGERAPPRSRRGPPGRQRSARARRAASRPAPTRRPPDARADAGSESGEAHRSGESDRAAITRRRRRAQQRGVRAAAARELGVEGVSGHCRALEHEARIIRKQRDLLARARSQRVAAPPSPPSGRPLRPVRASARRSSDRASCSR